MSESSPGARPLGGYRVLDLADARGAHCAKTLADLGADVVKVEPPGGDASRRMPPFKDHCPDEQTSLFFHYYNTNKRGITLNVDCPSGQDLLRQLAARADVVLHTSEPRQIEPRGLSYDALAAVNPALVVTSLTGFGLSGPHAEYACPELVAFAMSGAMYLSGEPGREPCMAPGCLAFALGSAVAAFGSIVALYARGASGRGQQVEVSAQECAALITDSSIPVLSAEGRAYQREGNTHSWVTPGGLYPAADGYVRIVGGQTVHWDALVDWMGRPEPIAQPEWRDRFKRSAEAALVDSIIAEFTASRTRAELFEEGQRRRIPVTPVYSPAEFIDSAWAARGYVAEVEAPGLGRYRTLGPPYSFSGTPLAIERPAPRLGEHNAEIYGDELGLAPAELTALRAANVI
jgi:benzylsuccinate CoA-transferase BbsE subunit